MKLHVAATDGAHVVTAYGAGFVSVDGVRHEHLHSLLLLPQQLTPDWTAAGFDALTRADFAFLAALDADVTLLGMPAPQRFPHPELLRPFVEAQKGIEMMEFGAACRTYNLLVGEGRRVAAALLFS